MFDFDFDFDLTNTMRPLGRDCIMNTLIRIPIQGGQGGHGHAHGKVKVKEPLTQKEQLAADEAKDKLERMVKVRWAR